MLYETACSVMRLGIMPSPVPLVTVVGAPIEVERFEGDTRCARFDELVEQYHRQYTKALRGLYDAHKDLYHKGRAGELAIIE